MAESFVTKLVIFQRLDNSVKSLNEFNKAKHPVQSTYKYKLSASNHEIVVVPVLF